MRCRGPRGLGLNRSDPPASRDLRFNFCIDKELLDDILKYEKPSVQGNACSMPALLQTLGFFAPKIMNTLEKAISIAAVVHAGQTDKADAPYILHPFRIMMKMKSYDAMVVAVLHDVVEDGRGVNSWTFERLRTEGFSEEVVAAIDCVTKRPGETYEQFVERAAANPIALEVKLADLEDNMNVLRMKEMEEKDAQRVRKYHRSWCRLSGRLVEREVSI